MENNREGRFQNSSSIIKYTICLPGWHNIPIINELGLSVIPPSEQSGGIFTIKYIPLGNGEVLDFDVYGLQFEGRSLDDVSKCIKDKLLVLRNGADGPLELVFCGLSSVRFKLAELKHYLPTGEPAHTCFTLIGTKRGKHRLFRDKVQFTGPKMEMHSILSSYIPILGNGPDNILPLYMKDGSIDPLLHRIKGYDEELDRPSQQIALHSGSGIFLFSSKAGRT